MSQELRLKQQDRIYDYVCFGILILGLLLRILLAIHNPYYRPMHDVGNLSDWDEVTTGHGGYIQYLYRFKVFPQVVANQFYHPPLFHMIGAFIFELFYKPDMMPEKLFEVIQLINSVFASISSYIAYLIYKKLNIKGMPLVAATAFVSLTTILMNIGEVVNNDCLFLLFSLLSFYFALRWYEDSSLKNIILTGLCIALGMLTKTSAVLIAPAIAVIFLSVFLRKGSKKNVLIFQYIVFCVVSIPLGLSWVIRNKIKFGLPFSFVPSLPDDSYMYIGNIGIIKRFVPYSMRCFMLWNNFEIEETERYNLWSSVLYNLCFEDNLFRTVTPAQRILGHALMAVTMVLITLAVICVIAGAFNKLIPNAIKFSLLAAVITPVAGLISFYIKYPFTCTASYRYIVVSLVLLPSMWAIMASNNKSKLGKILSAGLIGVTFVTAAITIALYSLVIAS